MGSYFGRIHRICQEKWARLDEQLRGAGIGALISNDFATVRYVTGYLPYLILSPGQGQPSVYPVGRGRPVLYPLSFYEEFARRRFPWLDVCSLPRTAEGIAAEIGRVLTECGLTGQKVGCTGLTPRIDQALRKVLGEDQVVDAEGIMRDVRTVKTPGEIELLREAVFIAEEGMRVALRAVGAGRTECDVAGEAELAMRKLGTESHAIAIRGRNAAFLQEISTDDMFLPGDWALIDLGCYRGGYRAEFARSCLVAHPLRGRQREMMDVVVRALESASALLRPGNTVGAVSRRAREVIQQGGYGDYAHPYPPGHGIGVTGFEHPHLTEDNEFMLRENMVMNIEPGIFIPAEDVGIRVEDIWLVRRDGPELLSSGVPRIFG